MRIVLLFMVALALSGCSGSEDSMQTEVSASKIELGQMNRDFAAALNAKDAKAAAALYTEDAVLIPPGEAPVRGREAIEEYWRGAIESGGVRDASVETMDARRQQRRGRGWRPGRTRIECVPRGARPQGDRPGVGARTRSTDGDAAALDRTTRRSRWTPLPTPSSDRRST